MATYQARRRDPLLDDKTQAVIERRGKEMIGVGLIGAGVALALALASYVPDDPSWLSATDAEAQNMLGRFGASVASPLTVIVGFGAWGLVALLGAWGVRFLGHRGAERALGRLIFAPIAVALAAIHASSLVPPDSWGHSFGLGGLFGDTVLGAMIGVLPFGMGLALKLLSVLSAAGVVVLGLFVLGFDRRELTVIGRVALLGTVMVYAWTVHWTLRALAIGALGLRLCANGLTVGLHQIVARRQARREEQAQARAVAQMMLPQDQPGPAMAPATRGFGAPQPLEARYSARFAAATTPDTPAAGAVRAGPAFGAVASVASVASARAASAPPVSGTRVIAAPTPEPTPVSAPPARAGGLPRMGIPAGIAGVRPEAPAAERLPDIEPELIETLPPEPDAPPPAPDRISARISEAIRGRITRGKPTRPVEIKVPPVLARAEPPLTARPEPWPEAQPTPVKAGIFARLGGERAPAVPEPEQTAPAPLPPGLPQGISLQPSAAAGHRTDPGIYAPRAVVQTPARSPAPSRRAVAERQPSLDLDETAPAYAPPPLALLEDPGQVRRHHLSQEALEENARMLESVLDDYGVRGEIVSVRPGPVVTMYELEPAPGLKASRVIGLADDIARSMSALSARVSTVPGRSVIGIELPNAHREKVVLREILSARDFGDSQMRLPLALGKDISGEPVVANLSKMPHLLIAGTTGSGKSVAINTMILSLLYKLSPEECRLIMIDPKMLELSVYDGIPHLLSPVVTDPKKAVVALKWVVGEMEERYRKMSKMGVRNIEGYNGRVRDALAKDEMFSRTVQTGFDDETGDPVFETEEFAPVTLPYIVVVVDEMADLMMVAGKEIEACIQRLAQMARASGIHLIMATQRPSVDVITGTIKANFPTRISFQVTSKIDSRTILGEMGAEQLLGQGDMLYMAGGGRISRVHGPFVSDEEVEEIVSHLKSWGPPEYVGGVVEGPDDDKAGDIDAVLGLGSDGGEDALYDQAVAVVLKDRKVSTSYIQRKLGIGYNKAARLVEQMEEEGLVGAANHVGKREILVPEQ